MTDPGNFKMYILKCIRLSNECLQLAEEVQSAEIQFQLGQAAELLVEAADRIRQKQ